jgi:RNA polymerase sigma-54 factor
VERNNSQWIVHLNNDTIPRLRISNTYKDLMARGGTKDDVRQFIRDRIRSGKFFIQCIDQRQQTIRRIAEEIVSRQKDFFEHGPLQLRPMNMAQVAAAVGVHETTVSRAVAGKYMATPRGTFEMKYFFTTGYQTGDGEAVSNTSVKQALAELIKTEDPSRPLSDDDLSRKLAEKGLKVARRTVAKYREALSILPSHLRRTYSSVG